MTADEKTGIYERNLIRKLLQSDQQTNSAYRRLIAEVAPILAKYRVSSRGVTINDPGLDRELNKHLLLFRKRIEEMIQTGQAWAWALSNEKNDQIISDYIANTPISKVAREGLFARNNEAFEAFQKRKYNGLNLSDRVWSLTRNNEELLKDYIDNALITGRSADDLSRDVRELLNEPNKLFRRVRNPKTGKLELSRAAREYHPGQGTYRSSYMNAKRLARTEINMAYRTADQERWKSLDFVLGYEVKLSNRHPRPDICDHAAGRYPKDFRFVGWHPQCLCRAVPILPNKKDFLDNLVDGKPLAGRVESVPKQFTDYVARNGERIAKYKQQPFWVQDNFKGGRIDGGIRMKDPVIEMGGNYVMEGENVYKSIGLKESLIRGESTEKAAIFDNDGNIITELIGVRNKLIIPESEIPKLKDNIFTHNHPEGTLFPVGDMRRIGNSLSWSDIYTAISGNVREMRAVTQEYTFSIIRPDKGWPDISTVKLVHSKINDETLDELTSLVRNGITTENKVNIVFYHLVNKKVFKYLNISYTKQKIKQ